MGMSLHRPHQVHMARHDRGYRELTAATRTGHDVQLGARVDLGSIGGVTDCPQELELHDLVGNIELTMEGE